LSKNQLANLTDKPATVLLAHFKNGVVAKNSIQQKMRTP